ncbi:MAG: TetR/AcrR family transcriptional regulator [Oscillospiraceae bacterium]|nr:TetR/AcrR family transcriptional regulator [Oscillospiraceae bacterium]
MNTPNNKRRKESQRRIENTFVRLLQSHDIDDLSITDICREAQVNRTTFYANYVDVYDLAQAVQRRLRSEVLSLYQDEINAQKNSHDFLPLFQHIKENQMFYNTYFKLGMSIDCDTFGYNKEDAQSYYNDRHINLHIAFFEAGLNAVLKHWLQGGCKESPEEINEVLKSEYFGSRQKRFSFFR